MGWKDSKIEKNKLNTDDARAKRKGKLKMTFSLKMICIALITIFVFSGCATILAGGPDMVVVNSNPQGATIILDGVPVGVTPATISFSRSCEGVVVLEKPGYQNTRLDVDKVVNGWVFGNLIIGGLIGLGVDLATSNQGKYSTSPIFLSMPPTQNASATSQLN